jgi:hypothetical protein
MHRLRTALSFALDTVACVLLATVAATAGAGSATLEDAIDNLQDEQALIAEIFAELKAQKLAAENVGCTAGRFDGDWRNLAGARTVPFECQLGKRKLSIQGAVHVYDDSGTELGLDDQASRGRATEFRQTDIKWNWK